MSDTSAAAPTPPNTPTPPEITADEFRALLKVAGLSVSEDRAPLVLDELNAQLALAQKLESVLENAPVPDFAPFDPTFPRIDLEDDAE